MIISVLVLKIYMAGVKGGQIDRIPFFCLLAVETAK